MDTVERELDTLGSSAEASDLAAPTVGHPRTGRATMGAIHRGALGGAAVTLPREL